MTIEQLICRVEMLEAQMVKFTINTDRLDEPVAEKPKKTVKKSKKTDEEKEAEKQAKKEAKEAEKEAKKAEKKETKKKEDGEPKKKRAPSAYNMFCQQMRQEAKDKVVEEEELGEDLKVPTTKVMQMLAKMWKELTEDEQKAYKPVVESDSE